ncbi:WD-40 repeat protein, partial [Reticulomyxa filosa]
SEEEIKVIIWHWVRISNIKLGWIHDFVKLVINYVAPFFMLDTFRYSSKLLKTFCGHTSYVCSIDCSTFGADQFICSGSADKTVRVWDVETNQQIRSFNGHSNTVYCVKFSPYHNNNNNNRHVICSSSVDNTIRFWDIKDDIQLQLLNGHKGWIGGIEFSSFNGGRYLCCGSYDATIRLWDVEAYKSLHVFNGHENCVICVDFSPLQNNNKNESNGIGVIGGNGYTICSGSFDNTIRIWDIETTKQLNVFKGHEKWIMSVKYGSNESQISGSSNTILSGSHDQSVRLWDIRSGQQIQVFNGILNELYVIKGDNKEDSGILCFKFLQLKQNRKGNRPYSYLGIVFFPITKKLINQYPTKKKLGNN